MIGLVWDISVTVYERSCFNLHRL